MLITDVVQSLWHDYDRIRPIAGIVFSMESVNQGSRLSAIPVDSYKLARAAFRTFILDTIPERYRELCFRNWNFLAMSSNKSLQLSLARSPSVASSTTAAATAAEPKR